MDNEDGKPGFKEIYFGTEFEITENMKIVDLSVKIRKDVREMFEKQLADKKNV